MLVDADVVDLSEYVPDVGAELSDVSGDELPELSPKPTRNSSQLQTAASYNHMPPQLFLSGRTMSAVSALSDATTASDFTSSSSFTPIPTGSATPGWTQFSQRPVDVGPSSAYLTPGVTGVINNNSVIDLN